MFISQAALAVTAFLSAATTWAAPVENARATSDLLSRPDGIRSLLIAETLVKRDVHFTKVTDVDFADPSIFLDYGTWYAFATNNHKNVAIQGGKLVNVQIARSPNFADWTVLAGQDALPKLPPWVDAAYPRVWAPKVIRNDAGKYVMHFSATMFNSSGKHCVGAALANTPAGPYTAFDKPFACPLAKGGAIDSGGFRDNDGALYVVYKVDGNAIGHGGVCGNTVAPQVPTPIMLQRVQGDGVTPMGAPVQILDRDAADGPLVEAPSIMHVPDSAGGGYVLFFSSNCYSSDRYDAAYAFARNIAGPYTKRGPLARTGTQGLFSPGGADIARDGVHMVMHAGNAGPTNGWRPMYVAKISVDARRQEVSST